MGLRKLKLYFHAFFPAGHGSDVLIGIFPGKRDKMKALTVLLMLRFKCEVLNTIGRKMVVDDTWTKRIEISKNVNNLATFGEKHEKKC